MNYELQIKIPFEFIMREETGYIESAIQSLKQRGAIEIFDEIYKHNSPIVVETHIETWDENDYPCKVYKLHYRLTAVQSRNVEIPVFTYTNHSGKIEWKCPACAMINGIEATFCGEKHYNAVGCGRPRDKTRQQYEAEAFL